MKVFWIVLICMILGINAMADENIMKTNQTTIANSADNKLLELSLKRRSIRTAPSSFGHRPVEFVIVKDKETIQKLADCKSLGGSQIIGADAVIAVMVNQDRGEFWIEDGAIASSYILLAAEQYNVGACWVQIRNRRGLKKTSDEEIRDLLNIPDNYAVLNLVALGGKGEQKKAYTENDFDKNKIHYEKY